MTQIQKFNSTELVAGQTYDISTFLSNGITTTDLGLQNDPIHPPVGGRFGH